VSAHKSNLSDLVNGLPLFQSVVHFFSDPCCYLPQEATEHNHVAFLNKSEAESHAVTSLFGMVVVVGRIDQLVSLEISTNHFDFSRFARPAISAISVSIIDDLQADAPLACDFFVMVKLRLSLRTAKITINRSKSAPAPMAVPCQRPCLWAAACAATEALASACLASG
jgi:hypothetical protein